VHHVHACIATEIGDFEEPLEHFREARRRFDEMASQGLVKELAGRVEGIFTGIANSPHGLGKYAKAEPMYQEALEFADPGDPSSAYDINLGRRLWSMEKYDEASKQFEEFIVRHTPKYGEDNVEDYCEWCPNLRSSFPFYLASLLFQGLFLDLFC
jgi:tetratricopeptide (TPR) repeat protein